MDPGRPIICFNHSASSAKNSSRECLRFFALRAALDLASGTTLVGDGIPKCSRAADFTALVALNFCFFFLATVLSFLISVLRGGLLQAL